MERRGIQSIEVGGTLLQALARHAAPMMLKDLAREAGMNAAKAHPYLVSFGKLGLVEQDTVSGLYKLGPFALQLGLSALHELDAIRIAGERAAQLSRAIRQNVALVVWGNRGPTVVRILECNRSVHVNMRTGTVMSLSQSATGRVFLAYLPEHLTGELLGEEGASEHELAAPLAEVRWRGMERAVGQPLPGINALSAPVFDYDGQLALVMTTLGPSASFDASWDGPLARELGACASEVSTQLGFRPRFASRQAGDETL